MSAVEAEVTELPSSPGARLRREREARDLTQQQVAEQLTLDVSVVTALEANDFAALGAPVFAKGHLRRYAALLELPEDDILGGYERSKAQPDQPTLVPRSRVEMAPIRGPSRWPYVLGGALAFIVAAALVAYVSTHGLRLPWFQSSPTVHASSAAEQASPASSPASGAAGPAVDSSGAPSVAATPAVAPAGQVSLQLRFATDSWIEVYDGTGKAVLYDLGKGGTDRTVTAVAPLSVTVGNAAAVGVSINGRAVRLPALPPGQTVARFGVGADGNLR